MVRILVIDDDYSEILILHDYLCKTNIKNGKLLDKEIGYLSPKDGTEAQAFSELEQIERLVSLLEKQWDSTELFIIDMALRGDLDEYAPVSQQAIEKFMQEGEQVDALNKNSITKRAQAIIEKRKFLVIITGHTTTRAGLKLPQNVLFELKPDWKIGHEMRGGIVAKAEETCHNSTICANYDLIQAGHKCYQNDCLHKLITALISRLEGL